jgi:hypothetical protein
VSKAWELQLAVVAALEADSGITALTADGLDSGIYDSRAKQGKALPYIVVMDNVESAFDTFDNKGHDGQLTGKCYGNDKEQALFLYMRVYQRLNRQTINLQGGLKVSYGRVTLLGAGLEEDVMRALWTYRALVR